MALRQQQCPLDGQRSFQNVGASEETNLLQFFNSYVSRHFIYVLLKVFLWVHVLALQLKLSMSSFPTFLLQFQNLGILIASKTSLIDIIIIIFINVIVISFSNNANRKERKYLPLLADLAEDYNKINFANFCINCLGIFGNSSN